MPSSVVATLMPDGSQAPVCPFDGVSEKFVIVQESVIIFVNSAIFLGKRVSGNTTLFKNVDVVRPGKV